MQSHNYKYSFYALLGLILFAPLFFIPMGGLELASAKSVLFTVGIIISALLLIFRSYQEGKVSLPKHLFIFSAIALPIVYFFSALLSSPSSISLMGYQLEIGTFGFILLGSLGLSLTALIFNETKQIVAAVTTFFTSLTLLTLFMGVKIFFGGDFLSFGSLVGRIGNPVGAWTDLAVVFGLLSLLCVIMLCIAPMRWLIRLVFYAVFGLSTLLLVVVNFSVAMGLTLIGSIFLFGYFLKFEKSSHNFRKSNMIAGLFSTTLMMPVLLGLISLIFLVNPTIPNQGKLDTFASNFFQLENLEVRPTLSATLDVSKAVLSENVLLGSGPNTFKQNWLIFKPIGVNATPFWGVAFPFGVGFIPTQLPATGIVGSLVWLSFFLSLLFLGVKVLVNMPESRPLRITFLSVILISLALWSTSLFYTPSAAILMLAFLFSGLLVAVGMEVGVVRTYQFSWKDVSGARIPVVATVVILVIGLLSLGFISGKKTIAAIYFNQAVKLAEVPGASLSEVEEKVERAIKFSPVDVHYVASAKINLLKAQRAMTATTGTLEENQALFQQALQKSILGVKSAVATNPAEYTNWITLGQLYSSLVPEPLKLAGAYENALVAYTEAYKRNPNNPELPLLLAQLEFNHGNVDAARSYIRSAIALKEDYALAYIMLAQFEIRAGNVRAAIDSARSLSEIVPNNPNVHFELGLLKYESQDYNGALASLNNAVNLAPDYANAKYYLGLTYVKLGRETEARSQFEELQMTNPDNLELQRLLNDLNTEDDN